MTDSFNLEEKLFAEALTLPTAERAEFLRRACIADGELRVRMEALLREHDEPSLGFLETPPERELAEAARLVRETPDEEGRGTCIGRYKLLEKIGEGGCGVVYMAEQEEPVRRKVALKIVKLGMDTRDVIARFEAERQALSLMDHPNIARVLDAGATASGRPYFVMELVRGTEITKYCDSACLSPKARLELFIVICRAIQDAHQKGIIHRDIKPSNILVTLHDGVPVPKVIDFGIAKAIEGRLTDKTQFTAFAQFVGTPSYMSPEQAEFSALCVDTRSDIYSLGVLLYKLLTGRTPFDSQELAKAGLDEMRRRIREEVPILPSTRLTTLQGNTLATVARQRQIDPLRLIRSLRGELDWIVMRCLEKDRTRRYETANALADDIRHYLQHEPIIARPPTRAYVLRKFIRRHRLALVASGAIAGSLLAGIVSFAFLFFHAQAERTRAELAHQVAYSAGLSKAENALRLARVGRARDFLGSLRPHAGEFDLRGFEWRALLHESAADTSDLLQTDGSTVRELALSPDGELIAGRSDDHHMTLWDAASHHVSAIIPDFHALGGFSFDGHWLIGTFRNDIRRWSVASREVELTTNAGPGEALAALNADRVLGLTLGTRNQAPKLFVRNFHDGKAAWTLPVGAPNEFTRVLRVAVSPDGVRCAVEVIIGSLFDSRTGLKIIDLSSGRILFQQSARLSALGFSHDGRHLACSFFETNEICPLDLRQFQWGWRQPMPAEVGVIIYSHDDQRIYGAADNSVIYALNADTGRVSETLQGHDQSVSALALSPRTHRLVSADASGEVRLWPESSQREAKEVSGLWPFTFGNSPSICVADDGSWLATTVDGSRIRLLRSRGLQFLGDLQDAIAPVASSADSRTLFSIGASNQFQEWSVTGTPVLQRTFPVLKGYGALSFASLSADQRLLVVNDVDGQIQCWERPTRTLLRELHSPREVRIRWAESTPDGVRIVAGANNTVLVWRVTTGALDAEIHVPANLQTAAISDDGRFLALGFFNGEVDIREPTTLRLIRHFSAINVSLRGLKFIDHDKRLVCCCGGGALDFFDTADWREIVGLFPDVDHGSAHDNTAYCVDYSASADLLAGYFADGRVRAWRGAP